MVIGYVEHLPKGLPKSVYPYLGIKDELIVFFTAPSTGFVIAIDADVDVVDDGNTTPEIGYSSNCWSERLFKPFKDKLILKNT